MRRITLEAVIHLGYILLDLHSSLHHTQALFNNCYSATTITGTT